MKANKIKIITVVGTRPEIIRLSEVIKELDRTANHILVHTGQNYDYSLSEIFFKDFGLRKPDYFLTTRSSEKLSAVEKTGLIFGKIESVLKSEQPEAFLVLGDTNSCLSAYVAKRHKIPIFHMEAGNRCFDERVPEEINRKIIDHLSDINMVYSERARDNLISEGLPLDRIVYTGSPMFEVLTKNQKSINSSNVLKRLSLSKGKYFVLSFHREENVDNLQNLIKILDLLEKHYKMPIIFSAHPRTRKKLTKENLKMSEYVRIMEPLNFFDFVCLEKNAYCVLSDSGTISEESAILDFPAVNLRETHERQEAMDEAAVVMSGLNPNRVRQAVELTVLNRSNQERVFKLPDAYACRNVSKKVARIILSYTDYVNRKVWYRI